MIDGSRADPPERPSDGPSARDTDQLMVRIGRGDAAAFDELYRRLGTRVYWTAHRLLRDPAMAEEVSQEVFLEIWRQAGQFNPSLGSAGAWITRLTHSRAIDRIRSVQRSRERDRCYTRSAIEEDEPSAADVAIRRLENATVRAALDSLTPIQRQSIELAYFQGHTCLQVAQMLAVPPSTIKTRIRDGLIRLRDRLEMAA